LAGVAAEKFIKPAVTTKAELKNASFFIEYLLVFPHGHVARMELRRLSCTSYAAHALVTAFNVRRSWRQDMSGKRGGFVWMANVGTATLSTRIALERPSGLPLTHKELRRYGSVGANSVRHKIRQDQLDPVDRTSAQQSIALVDEVQKRPNDESDNEAPAGNAVGHGAQARGLP